MTRILYVVTQSAPGGAQRYVLDLARSLPPQYEPVIAAGANGQSHLLEQAAELNLPTVSLEHLGRAINPLADMRAIRELRSVIQSWRPEIVHLNSTKAGVLGAWACAGRVRTVYTVHGWVFNEPLPWWRRAVYQHAERTSSRRIDSLIVLSESDRQAGLRLGLPATKMRLVRNGIELLEPLSPQAARAKLAGICGTDFHDRRIVLAIAGLYPTKGLNFLLAALPQLPQDICVVCLGDGPLRQNLEREVARRGLGGRVWLPGHAPDAWQLIPAASVFALPSLKEGLPYVLLEAMRIRVPIVATAVGGVPEVLDTMIVPPGDAAALAAGIRQQLERPVISSAEVPTLRQMVEQTAACYQALLA